MGVAARGSGACGPLYHVPPTASCAVCRARQRVRACTCAAVDVLAVPALIVGRAPRQLLHVTRGAASESRGWRCFRSDAAGKVPLGAVAAARVRCGVSHWTCARVSTNGSRLRRPGGNLHAGRAHANEHCRSASPSDGGDTVFEKSSRYGLSLSLSLFSLLSSLFSLL